MEAKNRNVLLLLLFQFSLLSAWHCPTTSLKHDILKNNTKIEYILFKKTFPFIYKKTPLANEHYLHPYEGFFKETFILTIPNGQVFGLDGWVLVNDTLINELIWQNVLLAQDVLNAAKNNPLVIKKGRVAVIAQSGHSYYYHWMVEVLGRLAILEMKDIKYDYLYVPNMVPYMKETLQLWGIDPEKIIEASDAHIIQADELIVPSLVSSVMVYGCPRLVHYIPEYIVQYIRAKLLTAALQQNVTQIFNKKVFISRQDATSRKIINENDVFSLFKAQGFERYCLTQLSVLEQILLFNNAEVIVGTLGSGLTNILFCNPETCIIELYQARRDCTIWNLSQMVGVKEHHCIKTTEFIDAREGQYDTEIPLEIIEEVIDNLLT